MKLNKQTELEKFNIEHLAKQQLVNFFEFIISNKGNIGLSNISSEKSNGYCKIDNYRVELIIDRDSRTYEITGIYFHIKNDPMKGDIAFSLYYDTELNKITTTNLDFTATQAKKIVSLSEKIIQDYNSYVKEITQAIR